MTEYGIYWILYDNAIANRSVAVCAAESDSEAVNLLKKSLVEGKGYESIKGDLNAAVEKPGEPKKGLIYG